MQGSEAELGGFRGRTNKLVDGCYSWWVGGCVVLVEGLLGLGEHEKGAVHEQEAKEQGKSDEEDAWDDVEGWFYFLFLMAPPQCPHQTRYSTVKPFKSMSYTLLSTLQVD